MPAITKFPPGRHLQKAQVNEQFSIELSQLATAHRDWQIVAVFYAAVHLLQAYFTAKTIYYPQTHQERDDLILRDPRLSVIYNDYRELKTLSVTCRYMCWPVNPFDVESARKSFLTIQSHIKTLL